MNIQPISFGMSAIFTPKGTDQFIKASAKATDAKADDFIRASEQFKRNMERTEHVDVVIDKTGILFPRLKAKVIKKEDGKKIATHKQSIWDKTETKFFEDSQRMTQKADKAFTTSTKF